MDTDVVDSGLFFFVISATKQFEQNEENETSLEKLKAFHDKVHQAIKRNNFFFDEVKNH